MPPAAAMTIDTVEGLAQDAFDRKVVKVDSHYVPQPQPPAVSPLDASKLIFSPNPSPAHVPAQDDPVIWTQSCVTDHMLTVKWSEVHGWEAPEIKAHGPLSLMPSAAVLQYATTCFEGLKAYRGVDGKVRLFRVSKNANRMLMSSTRTALPAFDPKELEKLIKALVAVDAPRWLPSNRTSMYIRPTMIGTSATVGLHAPKEAILLIIMSLFPDMSAKKPAQIPQGPNPTQIQKRMAKPGLKVIASQENSHRSWPGGFGYAKVGANYGPTILPGNEARLQGYDQILWLFGEQAEVTEAGASNFFIVWKTREGGVEIVTAPLDDKMILAGITRQSVLELAQERLTNDQRTGLPSVKVCERKIYMKEIVEAYDEGRLLEAFVSGTAFFVTAISEIHFRGKDITVPFAEEGQNSYAKQIRAWMSGIMFGDEPDHPWAVVVETNPHEA